MDIHMATELAFRNGYNKATAELRETAVWVESTVGEEVITCSNCKLENNRKTRFCPNCGRIMH